MTTPVRMVTAMLATAGIQRKRRFTMQQITVQIVAAIKTGSSGFSLMLSGSNRAVSRKKSTQKEIAWETGKTWLKSAQKATAPAQKTQTTVKATSAAKQNVSTQADAEAQETGSNDAYMAYYNAGFIGQSVEDVSVAGNTLTAQQKTAAWNDGAKAAATSLQKGKTTAFVNYGSKGTVVDTSYSRQLQKTSPKVYNGMQKLAGDMGVNILVEDMPDELNGSIVDGVIRMNSRALKGENRNKTIAKILSHETTHRFKETAAEAHEKYREHALQAVAKENKGSLNDVIRKYQQKYKENAKQVLDNEAAMDEIVADYTQRFIEDTKAFKDFVAENRSLGRKLIDAFKWVIDKIKSTFSGKAAQDAAAMDALGVSLADAEQALKLWEKAYQEAKKAVKKAPIGGKGSGTAKNMASDYSSAGISWLLSDGVINEKQMARFYETVANIQKLGYACPMSKSGLYMVDLGNVIAFTDADYSNPQIYKATEFFTNRDASLGEYKGWIYDEESKTGKQQFAIEAIQNLQGDGYVSEHIRRDYTTYARKVRSGQGTNGGRTAEESADWGNSDSVNERFSVAGTDKIISRDNEYIELAKDPEGNREQLQQMVDEAAKVAGYTNLFYHGAKNGGGFTLFRDWSYFTENEAYASRYAKRDTEGSMYKVFAKMDNPFDTRLPAVQRIFENSIRPEYGTGEIQDSGLPDWTDGYDIADYIEENSLEYDSIILDEGGDLVRGNPVSRGLSYAGNGHNPIFYKRENDAWTAVTSSLSLTGFSGLLCSMLIEYNGKIHSINGKYHSAFDGTTGYNYTNLPSAPYAQMAVHDGKLLVHNSDDMKIYQWDEETDTWSEYVQTNASQYSYYKLFSFNGDLYGVQSNYVNKLNGGNYEQVATLTYVPSTMFMHGDYLYYNVTRNPPLWYKYDLANNVETFLGYDLKHKLCEELDEIAEKPDLSAGDLETIHKLTDTIKNIDKIMMLEEGEYSQDGSWEARGSYDGGSSYRRGSSGMHYVRGHYSRDDGYSQRYSRHGGNSKSILEDMLRNAKSDRERRAIEKCMDEMQ